MSPFATKCRYTTAALQHTVSFGNADPVTSLNLRFLQLQSWMLFPQARGSSKNKHSPTCHFYTVILTRHCDPVFIFFFFLLNNITQLKVSSSLASPASQIAAEFPVKGATEIDSSRKARRLRCALPYPDRRLVNVVVGLCVMGCGLKVMFEAQQMQGLWLEIAAQRHSALTV